MRNEGVVEKGWGSEEIWVTNDLYCSKLMNFKQDAKFSMHFHAKKTETWRIMSGEFLVNVIDTSNAKQSTFLLTEGDVWHNDVLVPHQLVCIKKGTVLEVSTSDSVEDNYRVMPGDSQK